tara:strand:+ start:4434 stop:4730 length:297 start_codon:yes stop_codon:yes gene_type:complete
MKWENRFKVLRQKISHRGGGIEIDLSPFGYEGEKMSAYQNYLGGGMLGGVGSDCTIKDWEDNHKLRFYAEKLQVYYTDLVSDALGYNADFSGLPLRAY